MRVMHARCADATEYSQLNEIDDLHHICENHVTSTTDANRHPPQFKVHSMVAKALSPPKPMQALRERLIQDGSIIPNSDSELENRLVVNKEIYTRHIKPLERIGGLVAEVEEIGYYRYVLRKYRNALRNILSTPVVKLDF